MAVEEIITTFFSGNVLGAVGAAIAIADRRKGRELQFGPYPAGVATNPGYLRVHHRNPDNPGDNGRSNDD
jgi:hypothetical protein